MTIFVAVNVVSIDNIKTESMAGPPLVIIIIIFVIVCRLRTSISVILLLLLVLVSTQELTVQQRYSDR